MFSAEMLGGASGLFFPQCDVSGGDQLLTAAFVCHAEAGRSARRMKCSGDLWRRKPC